MENILSKIDWNMAFGYKKYTFTLAEIRDLLISVAVLGIVFSFGDWSLKNYLMSIAIVGPALLFHELAHKLMAQKYDLLAVYVMWPTGIAIALLFSVLTMGNFVFAALGAVMISPAYHTRLGYRFIGLTSSQLGKISIVGPMTNIVLAIISYILLPYSPVFFAMSAHINIIIALFNCLPIPPLDGTKIFRWNIPVWLGIFASAIVLWLLPPFIGLLWSIIISILLLVGSFILVQFFFPVGQQSATEFK
ncbi:MAG: hypothetical protein PHC66_03390 [Candidatus Nanoarchaeia archaeon]|nr:hypothetical protein [Candidatus Nanoarchaeia archaeon]MDD5239835.1 hypothetical protein [Candidatus Nanoarchaeia archaeon]